MDLLLDERISLLVNRTLIHEHNASYCFNTKQRRATETCRFNVPRELQPVSRIVFKFKVGKCPPTVEVTVKQNHDVLNPHSRAFVAANGANADLRLVLDSESAIAYLVKYTLKNSASKPFLQDLQRVFRSQAAIGVSVNPNASRIAQKLLNGEYYSAAHVFSDISNSLHSMVEVGLPQISYFLLSKPMVRFWGVKFANVPSIDERTVTQQPGGGVAINKKAWDIYSDLDFYALQNEQIALRTFSVDELQNMIADTFSHALHEEKRGNGIPRRWCAAHCIVVLVLWRPRAKT